MRRAREVHWESLQVEYVRLLREHTGATEDVALRVAADLVLLFRRRFGGLEVYVPQPPRFDEQAVLRDFTGRNADQVCAKHHIHAATLYRVVARARDRGESVPGMPPPPSPAPMDYPKAAPRGGKSDDFNW